MEHVGTVQEEIESVIREEKVWVFLLDLLFLQVNRRNEWMNKYYRGAEQKELVRRLLDSICVQKVVPLEPADVPTVRILNMLVNLGHRNRKTSCESLKAETCRQNWKFSPPPSSSKIGSKTFLDYQTSDLKPTSGFLLITRFSICEYYGSENESSSMRRRSISTPLHENIWSGDSNAGWRCDFIIKSLTGMNLNLCQRPCSFVICHYLVTTCNSLRGEYLKNDYVFGDLT